MASSSSLPTEMQILPLQSKDGELFDITKSEAAQSAMIKSILEASSSKENDSSSSSSKTIPPSSASGAMESPVPGVSSKETKESVVTLPNVHSRTLAVVTAYLKKHGNPEVSEDDKDKYDSEEIATRPLVELLHIFLAADYLEIKGLFDVVAKAIADNIKDLPIEKVREVFNIKNDYTLEEEEEIRQQHPWLHDSNSNN